MPAGVVLSYALTRNGREKILANAIEHTGHAAIIVHTSYGFDVSRYKGIQAKYPSRSLHFNPQQLKIEHKNAPGVLAAHLSNFAMCEQRELPCHPSQPEADDVKFVLMASNSALFRPGLEEWVSRHSMSFCIGNECSDLEHKGVGYSWTMEGWRPLLAQHAWSQQPPSELYLRQRALAASGNDSVVASDGWVAGWVALMRSGKAAHSTKHPRMWRAAPINLSPHEGAFYPVHVLRAFVHRALPGSAFEESLQHSSRAGGAGGRQQCPCCSMYEAARLQPAVSFYKDGKLRELGNCGMVETLLPTFVWQHYPSLIATSSPPIVMRVWAELRTAANRTLAARNDAHATRVEALALHLRHARQGYQQVHGLKFPKHEFNHLHKELARVSGRSPQLGPDAFGKLTRAAAGGRAHLP